MFWPDVGKQDFDHTPSFASDTGPLTKSQPLRCSHNTESLYHTWTATYHIPSSFEQGCVTCGKPGHHWRLCDCRRGAYRHCGTEKPSAVVLIQPKKLPQRPMPTLRYEKPSRCPHPPIGPSAEAQQTLRHEMASTAALSNQKIQGKECVGIES